MEISKYGAQPLAIKLIARARKNDQQIRALIVLAKDPGLILNTHTADHRPGVAIHLPLLISKGIRNKHGADLYADKYQ